MKRGFFELSHTDLSLSYTTIEFGLDPALVGANVTFSRAVVFRYLEIEVVLATISDKNY